MNEEGALCETTILEELGRAVKDYDVKGGGSMGEQRRGGRDRPAAGTGFAHRGHSRGGRCLWAGELILPELASAAEAMQAAMPAIEEKLHSSGQERESVARWWLIP